MEERLKLFLAMEGLSPSQFADKLGVQRSGVSHLLAGRNKPSFEFISKMLAAYPKLNPDWLIMGTGKAYRDFAEGDTPAAAPVFAQESPAPSYPQESPVNASLEENSVNDDMPDILTVLPQPQAPVIPEPKPQVQAPKPQAPPQKRPEPAPIQPAAGKHIAQITILYTDGTYEVR